MLINKRGTFEVSRRMKQEEKKIIPKIENFGLQSIQDAADSPSRKFIISKTGKFLDLNKVSISKLCTREEFRLRIVPKFMDRGFKPDYVISTWKTKEKIHLVSSQFDNYIEFSIQFSCISKEKVQLSINYSKKDNFIMEFIILGKDKNVEFVTKTNRIVSYQIPTQKRKQNQINSPLEDQEICSSWLCSNLDETKQKKMKEENESIKEQEQKCHYSQESFNLLNDEPFGYLDLYQI